MEERENNQRGENQEDAEGEDLTASTCTVPSRKRSRDRRLGVSRPVKPSTYPELWLPPRRIRSCPGEITGCSVSSSVSCRSGSASPCSSRSGPFSAYASCISPSKITTG